MKQINEGDFIGQAIVVEGDDMDVFGNHKPNSQAMVMESYLSNSGHKTKEVAQEMANRGILGRVIICKLVAVEEVLPNNQ